MLNIIFSFSSVTQFSLAWLRSIDQTQNSRIDEEKEKNLARLISTIVIFHLNYSSYSPFECRKHVEINRFFVSEPKNKQSQSFYDMPKKRRRTKFSLSKSRWTHHRLYVVCWLACVDELEDLINLLYNYPLRWSHHISQTFVICRARGTLSARFIASFLVPSRRLSVCLLNENKWEINSAFAKKK